jgi:hypothetical protein
VQGHRHECRTQCAAAHQDDFAGRDVRAEVAVCDVVDGVSHRPPRQHDADDGCEIHEFFTVTTNAVPEGAHGAHRPPE